MKHLGTWKTPAFAWMAAVLLVPSALTVYRAIVPAPDEHGIPLLNVLANQDMRASISRTLVFSFAVATAETILGLALGLALGRLRRFRVLAALVIAMPLFVPSIVTGLMWRWLTDPLRGILPYFLSGLIDTPFLGLSSPQTALLMIGAVTIWQWTPLVALVTASSVATLPTWLPVQASLDGLGTYASWRYVIWPHVRNAVLFIFVVRMLDSLRTFDLVYVLTQGGPGSSTELLSFTIFQRAFVFLDPNGGAGATAVLIAVSAIVMFVTTSWMSRRTAA